MTWLIDALRDPAAELLGLVGLAAVAALQQRVRGRVKRLERDVRPLREAEDGNRRSGL